jgi:hypothetical protein
MENRTESCCFWDHFIIHFLLEIARNRVPKKVKRTESCFTAEIQQKSKKPKREGRVPRSLKVRSN